MDISVISPKTAYSFTKETNKGCRFVPLRFYKSSTVVLNPTFGDFFETTTFILSVSFRKILRLNLALAIHLTLTKFCFIQRPNAIFPQTPTHQTIKVENCNEFSFFDDLEILNFLCVCVFGSITFTPDFNFFRLSNHIQNK